MSHGDCICCEENAQLIAALRQCREALEAVSHYESDEGPCYGGAPCCLMTNTTPKDRASCIAARAALAKAREVLGDE